MRDLLYTIYKIIDLYSIIILISIFGSWVDRRNESPFFRFINRLTDPYLKLFRVVIPMGNMGLDISPVIGIFLLNSLKTILTRLLYF